MKTITKYILASIAILALIIACTKEVGLYTEVEFEITEEHKADGFISTPLATSITVTPEELVEGYSYTYSYKINTGEGYFQDESGNTIAEGDKIGLNPLSASLNYIATKIGDHSITFTAEDTFGFQEQVTASYAISDVPVSWTATGPSSQVLLGTSQDITLILGSETTGTGVTYERNYSFTQGTGTITSSPSGASEALNEFVSITPGTYALEYVSTELGQTTLEFLLKDSNGQEIVQTVSFEVVDELSTEKEITSFIVNGVAGTPSGTSINLVLPEGTDLTALAPVIIHTGASIFPESETSQDFTNPVEYSVMAQDGSIQIWNVTITNSTTAVTSVIIDQYTDTMTVNGSQTLTATITPANASNQTITWISDDQTIAIINSAGVVEALAAGTVSIKAIVDGVFDTVEITVTAIVIPVISVSIDTYTDTMTVNESQILTATINPSNASNQTIMWTSSDETRAIITNSGEVDAIAAGTVSIEAAVDGKIDTIEITILPIVIPVISVSIDTYTDTMTVSDSQILTATINPSNASNQTITWTSSDETRAIISNSGELEAIAAGTVSIEAAVDGKIDNIEITILPILIPVISVNIDPHSDTMNVSDSQTLTATINPSNASNQTITWSSSNEAIATINSSGEVEAITTGTFLIKAAVDGKIDTVEITVVNRAPTAVATGPTTTTTGVTENFYADSSSDPDGDNLTYLWDFGDTTTSNLINPTHSYTTAGPYTVALTVTDNGTPNLDDTVTITISVSNSANQLPVVSAGDDQEVVGLATQFSLSGTASDPDGTIEIILWEKISGGSATIVNQNSLTTAVTGFSGGLYEFRLTVTDNLGGVSSDIVRINVTACPTSCPSGEAVCFDPATNVCECRPTGGPNPVLCVATD
ncbi:Ig-like domain-containing protein [Cellulophaga sp. L1A9]|uniref:Ig-like domain-containing protein n=1 Tax=Cellulophaga sp. L1A9 TaxID=2686362 RepID=UPI00131C09E5|nr:Ig-like domain-containing protein [Cellulophaga sp. L1A9]